jgi:hypothetical protein
VLTIVVIGLLGGETLMFTLMFLGFLVVAGYVYLATRGAQR